MLRPIVRLSVVSVIAFFFVGCQPAQKSTTGNRETKSVSGASTDASSSDTVPLKKPSDSDDATAMAPLGIGDSAPALQISKWVKGDPVIEFSPGKIYVVEFWATWCPPCRTSMPHLSELQEKYEKDVTFIGISDEDAPTVEAFIEGQHDEEHTWDQIVNYTLALDQNGQTNQNYMLAAGQDGIPAAFVVGRDGIVEWIGHPMGIDEPLDAIVAGSWDREAAKEELERQKEMQKQFMVALKDIGEAIKNEQPQDAVAQIHSFLEKYPDDVRIALFGISRLTQASHVETAAALADGVAHKHWDDAEPLNAIAWTLANLGEKSLLETALKITERSKELTAEKDASVLDTLARIHFEQGNLEAAVEWQQKCVDIGEDIPSFQERLEEYRKKLEETGQLESDGDSDNPDASDSSESSDPSNSSNKPDESNDRSSLEVEPE